MKNYSELSLLKTFLDRFRYLNLAGTVGEDTFGFDRWLNQKFYRSRQWQQVRTQVIARDQACDLGVNGYDLQKDLLIHHMNPITPSDIATGQPYILDPEFLITTSRPTHNAIHYGDESLLPSPFIKRTIGDTNLWSSLSTKN